jgi:hypothetical protein
MSVSCGGEGRGEEGEGEGRGERERGEITRREKTIFPIIIRNLEEKTVEMFVIRRKYKLGEHRNGIQNIFF